MAISLQGEDGRTAPGVCGNGFVSMAEPLRERRYENWNTHTLHCRGIKTKKKKCMPKKKYLCLKLKELYVFAAGNLKQYGNVEELPISWCNFSACQILSDDIKECLQLPKSLFKFNFNTI